MITSLDDLWNALLGPLQGFVDFGLALAYLFHQLLLIIGYLLSPFLFFIKYLEGVFSAWTNPASITNPIHNDPAVVSFIAAIPGMSVFLLILAALFWFLVFKKTLKTLKY